MTLINKLIVQINWLYWRC